MGFVKFSVGFVTPTEEFQIRKCGRKAEGRSVKGRSHTQVCGIHTGAGGSGRLGSRSGVGGGRGRARENWGGVRIWGDFILEIADLTGVTGERGSGSGHAMRSGVGAHLG